MTDASGAGSIDVSVVVPVYNGAETLRELTARLQRTLATGGTYEIIFVDDGSRDSSFSVLAQLSKADDRVRAFRLARNRGQHRAILHGFRHTQGARVVFLDDDLQHPPEEIPSLLAALSRGYRVAIARFPEKHHPPLKNLASGIKRRVEHWAYRTPSGLYVSGFTALEGGLAHTLANSDEPNPYLPGLIYRHVAWQEITNVGVRHDERRSQRSRYGPWRSLTFVLNLLRTAHRNRAGGSALRSRRERELRRPESSA